MIGFNPMITNPLSSSADFTIANFECDYVVYFSSKKRNGEVLDLRIETKRFTFDYEKSRLSFSDAFLKIGSGLIGLFKK